MNTIINILKEVALRVNAESPELFKKIQWASGVLVMLITFALSANASLGLGWGLVVFFKIPLTTILAGIAGTLTAVFGVSKLPVKDADILVK